MLSAQCRDRLMRLFVSVFGGSCRKLLNKAAIFLTPANTKGGVFYQPLLKQLLFGRLHNRVTHLLYCHLGAVD
jgi:hypothetical protein